MQALRELDLVVLRHCEKAGDGLSDPLTERGRADALRVAERLSWEGIERIWASPYRRSLETILPFAEASGLEVVVDARLAEWQLSDAAMAEIHVHAPKMLSDARYRSPWSETAEEVWRRVGASLADLSDLEPKRTALACHGGILGAVLMHLADRFGPEDWATFHQPTIVALRQGTWRKLGLDERPGPLGASPEGAGSALAGEA
ncbi:MAG: histidine phosphatase family protein [Pseudomonadota bacterium]